MKKILKFFLIVIVFIGLALFAFAMMSSVEPASIDALSKKIDSIWLQATIIHILLIVALIIYLPKYCKKRTDNLQMRIDALNAQWDVAMERNAAHETFAQLEQERDSATLLQEKWQQVYDHRYKIFAGVILIEVVMVQLPRLL